MTATKHSPRLFQGFLSFAPCAPSSRAHAFTPSPLDDLPLSPPVSPRPRCVSCLASSWRERAAPLPPLLHSRRRTARCPGRSEQLSPAFPPSHGACASRGCPPRSPRVLSFCLPDQPSCGCPLGPSSVHTPPSSFVPILLSSRCSASARLLTRLLPAFLLFPSFLLDSRCFYRPSSSSPPVLSRRTIHAHR